MTFQEWTTLISGGGIAGVVGFVFLKLHQSAVNAERRRAEVAEAREKVWEAIAKEREAQLMDILRAVKEGQERASSS